MVAGCGMTCIKYIVFAVNFLFFVMGIAATALGIYALVDKNDMHALTKLAPDGAETKLEDFNGVGLMQSGAIVLIVGGVFLLLLGFFGCCGAVKESRCLLGLYAGIIIIIIIIQVTAAGLGIAFKTKIEDYLVKGMKANINAYYNGSTESSNPFSRAFDFAQVYFECCGVTNSSADFAESMWFNRTRKSTQSPNVPDTCCTLTDKDAFFNDNKVTLKDPSCPTTAIGATNPHTSVACASKIEDWVVSRAGIIIGIALGIVFIEIMAIIFACCLMRAIQEEGGMRV